MDQVRMGLSESIGRITLLSLIIFVVLFALALFLSVVVPNSIVKPIHHINDITNQVAIGDLTVRANVKQGAEVIKLGESLNSMIEKIDNLLTAVKIDEKNLREAELELLQSRSTHFLYNTLDTIIWIAESGQQGQLWICQLLIQLFPNLTKSRQGYGHPQGGGDTYPKLPADSACALSGHP
jgi:two-component system sensor histidine kinase YesM